MLPGEDKTRLDGRPFPDHILTRDPSNCLQATPIAGFRLEILVYSGRITVEQDGAVMVTEGLTPQPTDVDWVPSPEVGAVTDSHS